MIVDNDLRLQRIDDCRELYVKHEGQHHELIESEMRALGHGDFHRRSLYDRFERGKHKAGWIGRFGFNALVRRVKEKADHEAQIAAMRVRMGFDVEEALVSEPPAVAGGLTSPTTTIDVLKTPVSYVASDNELANNHLQPPATAGGSDLPDFTEFLAWLKQVSPTMTWEWKHQVYIYKRLRRVSEGLCKRLMIFLPPRHGKSELVTVRYSAWRLKQDPTLNIILGSYNQRLANRFSRKIRRVLTDDAAQLRIADCGMRIEDTESAANAISDSSQQNKRRNTITPANPQSAIRDPQSNDSPFPFTHRRANSEAEWETSQGGGLRAVGVGGGVTGFGAGLIIIDDPVKSRAEAESPTYRDNIWDWFNDDLYTRLEPEGAIILIQTRWHEDDLAGRLLRESREEGGEHWEVVNLPALAEGMSLKGTKIIARAQAEGRHPGYDAQYDADPEGVEQTAYDVAPLQGAPVLGTRPGVPLAPLVHPRLLSLSPSATGDPLGRLPGQALCPERYNEEALDRLKRKLGSYSFAALYQQRPVPAEGGLFKRNWFKNIIHAAPEGLRWSRGYDLAMSNTITSDYTASFRVAYDREGNLYIDGGFRRRMEYPEQRRYILGRIEAERDTQHSVELSANGNAVIQDLRREQKILRRFLGK